MLSMWALKWSMKENIGPLLHNQILEVNYLSILFLSINLKCCQFKIRSCFPGESQFRSHASSAVQGSFTCLCSCLTKVKWVIWGHRGKEWPRKMLKPGQDLSKFPAATTEAHCLPWIILPVDPHWTYTFPSATGNESLHLSCCKS